jgi:hypothetical protein
MEDQKFKGKKSAQGGSASGRKLTAKEQAEYWQKKEKVLNQEEHDEFIEESGMNKEKHDAWHRKYGGKV